MTGLTIKQETFAQRYVETGNASEAYRQAYGSTAKSETIAPNASRLLRNTKVAARVDALRAGIRERHAVTLESLLDELEEARKVGKGKKQAAGMVAATMGKARLTGLDEPKPAPLQNLTIRVRRA